MKLILKLILVLPLLAIAQPSSSGVYFNGIDNQLIVPFTKNINTTVTKNRTYETYFKANTTYGRQIIMKEGASIRAAIVYIENGYLILGAFNRADYNPKWSGTFYRMPINANQWYHLALVFDNARPANYSTNTMTPTANTDFKFYLNCVLEGENSGYQFGKHNSLRLGYKNESLRFPNCATWSNAAGGSAEYCFNNSVYDGGGNEYYFNGYLWGFRVWNDVRTPAEICANKDNLIMTVGTDDLVAALDGDTLTFLDNSNNPVDTSVNNQIVHVWKTNAVTSDWYTSSNWESNNVPHSLRLESVRIPGGAAKYPRINSHTVVGNVDLDAGAKLTVLAGGTIDVGYDLINDGTLKVEDKGSLLVREGKEIIGSGQFIIERDTRDYPADYYSIWSSPLVKADSQIGNTFTNNIIGIHWDASSNPSKYVFINKSTLMEEGKGYFIRSDEYSGVLKRTFTGRVNNGTVTHPVYYKVGGRSNLMGNPYPSAIDWAQVYNDNSDLVEGTIYYWKQTYVGKENLATDYIPYNLTGSNVGGVTGKIGTAQGFYVKTKKNGDFKFENTQRVVGNNSQFFRTTANSDKNKLWLQLTNGSLYSSILLGYIKEATDGYTPDYDAKYKGSKAAIKLYSILGEDNLAIQAKSALSNFEEDRIPLGFEVATAGNYSIAIMKEYIDSAYDILLEDKLKNTMTNLRQKAYNVSFSEATLDNERFVLHLKHSNKDIFNDALLKKEDNTITTYFKHNALVTNFKGNNTSKIQLIELYDVSGKLVVKKPYKQSFSLSVAPGVYLAKYILNDGTFVVKKVIKKD